MSSSISKILQIFLGVLMLISVVLIALFYFGGNENELSDVPKNTDILIYWGYALFVISAAAAIIFPIVGLIKQPKSAISAIIGIVVLGIFFGIAYALSDGTPLELNTVLEDNNPATLKFADTGLYAMYLLLIIAIVGIFYTAISKVFKK